VLGAQRRAGASGSEHLALPAGRPVCSPPDDGHQAGTGSGRVAMVRRMKKLILLLALIGLAGLAAKQLSSS
jgi:hypothetical protein